MARLYNLSRGGAISFNIAAGRNQNSIHDDQLVVGVALVKVGVNIQHPDARCCLR